MALSGVFRHYLPLCPGSSTRALYLGFNAGLNTPSTPLIDDIVPRL